jgi:DNA-binding XRE family transcriptional regulator
MNSKILIKGLLFKKVRKNLHIKIEILAKFLNLSTKTILVAERSNFLIDPDWIKALATIKDVSIEYIENMVNEIFAAQTNSKFSAIKKTNPFI